MCLKTGKEKESNIHINICVSAYAYTYGMYNDFDYFDSLSVVHMDTELTVVSTLHTLRHSVSSSRKQF